MNQVRRKRATNHPNRAYPSIPETPYFRWVELGHVNKEDGPEAAQDQPIDNETNSLQDEEFGGIADRGQQGQNKAHGRRDTHAKQ